MSLTQVYAIFGHPVAHTRSPAMHNGAFAALGMHATYVPFDVLPDALPAAIAGMRAMGLRGANLTVPHKTAVIPLLDGVDKHAEAIGAVNTLTWQGGKLIGRNTDAPGLSRSLAEAGVQLKGAQVVVLGAGGAARAAMVGMAHAGAAKITLAARRPRAATELKNALSGPLGETGCSLNIAGMTELDGPFATCDLLIQATSATLGTGAGPDAFAASLPLHALPNHATVTDLVYKPLTTSVMRAAEARGLATVDGLGMLLHQGALAFEYWTDKKAPLDVMRAALTAQ